MNEHDHDERTTGNDEHGSTSVSSVVRFFVQEVLGGVLLGLVLGFIVYRLLKSIDDYEIEVMITLGMRDGWILAGARTALVGAACDRGRGFDRRQRYGSRHGDERPDGTVCGQVLGTDGHADEWNFVRLDRIGDADTGYPTGVRCRRAAGDRDRIGIAVHLAPGASDVLLQAAEFRAAHNDDHGVGRTARRHFNRTRVTTAQRHEPGIVFDRDLRSCSLFNHRARINGR